MEASGWRELLIRHPRLKWELAGTSIFVASHHGRVSGCCEEIFELFRPEIVVISDDSLQFDTQETTDWYRQRCLGASLVVDPSQCRYVVTTRKDGDVRIIVNPDGTWLLTPVTVQDWSLSPIPQTPNFWEALKPTLGF
jgi:hypothetical protein